MMRSRDNVGLAEETRQPGEDEDVQTMIDEMRRHLVRDFPRADSSGLATPRRMGSCVENSSFTRR